MPTSSNFEEQYREELSKKITQIQDIYLMSAMTGIPVPVCIQLSKETLTLLSSQNNPLQYLELNYPEVLV